MGLLSSSLPSFPSSLHVVDAHRFFVFSGLPPSLIPPLEIQKTPPLQVISPCSISRLSSPDYSPLVFRHQSKTVISLSLPLMDASLSPSYRPNQTQTQSSISGQQEVTDIFESSLTLENIHYDEGYADGYRDGAISGKQDGYEVGLKHGFQVGEELGFYRGLFDVWLSAIRVDPSCFSTRVQKTIHQMSDLLHNYPLQDPESQSVDETKANLRLKFRAVCASLGVKLEYDGYPKTSNAVEIEF